jgi:hypothetical protein
LKEEHRVALKSLGIITVEIRKIKEYIQQTRPKGVKCNLPEVGPLSERLMKGDARTHKARYEEPNLAVRG